MVKIALSNISMRTSFHQGHLLQPRRFGRGKSYVFAAEQSPSNWTGDVRLFVTTFAAGFLFVSLYLA